MVSYGRFVTVISWPLGPDGQDPAHRAAKGGGAWHGTLNATPNDLRID